MGKAKGIVRTFRPKGWRGSAVLMTFEQTIIKVLIDRIAALDKEIAALKAELAEKQKPKPKRKSNS
jgi:hypothetical protein